MIHYFANLSLDIFIEVILHILQSFLNLQKDCSLKIENYNFQLDSLNLLNQMGVACSDCNRYQEEFSTLIIVSKDNFSSISADPNLLQKIQALTDNQIPESFTSYQFYRKAPDTFFIGSLQQKLQKNFGILYKPGETLFYGDFQNSLIHGKGSLKLIRDNLSFKGEFCEGKPNGKGQLQDNDKTFQFNGIWKGSTKPYSGVLKLYSNKIIEQIQFIDFQHGDAQIYYRNGSLFKGFIDKKTLLPNGSGKMTYLSGDYYEGQWTDGKFYGMGTYIWKTGQKYNGQYFEGLRHGNGDFYYKSGKYYKGEWRNGKKEGFGKILGSDGKLIQKGIYRNDIFDNVESDNFDRKQMEKLPILTVKSELVEGQGKDEASYVRKQSAS